MNLVKKIISRGEEMGDLFGFLWRNKLWFMVPFIVVLMIIAFVFIAAGSSGLAPFIYTLI